LDVHNTLAVVPEQRVCACGFSVNTGVGFTVTVKDMFAPEQPFNVPLTEIVPTNAPPLTFTGACQPEMFPEPLPINPMV
jgi:hypothetical protein